MPYLCKGIIMHYNTYLLMTNSFKHLAQSIWFIFGFLSVNNSWNVPEITHCCFPHVNNAHAVYLRLCSVCFSPSAHPSSIPLSSNLKTCQNCLLPSSLSLSLSFRVAVTSFGREMDSAQFRFCSVSSLRQSDYQSAAAKQIHTRSLNEALVLLHERIDSEHLGSGWNQNNLFKSGLTKSRVNLDLHERFLAGHVITFYMGEKRDKQSN